MSNKIILELPADVGTQIYIPCYDARGRLFVSEAVITGYEWDGNELIAHTNLNYYLRVNQLYFSHEEAQAVCDKYNNR